jgi:hypothetical protein
MRKRPLRAAIRAVVLAAGMSVIAVIPVAALAQWTDAIRGPLGDTNSGSGVAFQP